MTYVLFKLLQKCHKAPDKNENIYEFNALPFCLKVRSSFLIFILAMFLLMHLQQKFE